MTPDAAANNVAAINRVGQQVAKELILDLDAAAIDAVYSDDHVELNIDVAPQQRRHFRIGNFMARRSSVTRNRSC